MTDPETTTPPEIPDDVIHLWMQTPREHSIDVATMGPDDLIEAKKDFEVGAHFFNAMVQDISMSKHFHPDMPLMALSGKFTEALTAMGEQQLMAIIVAAAWDIVIDDEGGFAAHVRDNMPDVYKEIEELHKNCDFRTPMS